MLPLPASASVLWGYGFNPWYGRLRNVQKMFRLLTTWKFGMRSSGFEIHCGNVVPHLKGSFWGSRSPRSRNNWEGNESTLYRHVDKNNLMWKSYWASRKLLSPYWGREMSMQYLIPLTDNLCSKLHCLVPAQWYIKPSRLKLPWGTMKVLPKSRIQE